MYLVPTLAALRKNAAAMGNLSAFLRAGGKVAMETTAATCRAWK